MRKFYFYLAPTWFTFVSETQTYYKIGCLLDSIKLGEFCVNVRNVGSSGKHGAGVPGSRDAGVSGKRGVWKTWGLGISGKRGMSGSRGVWKMRGVENAGSRGLWKTRGPGVSLENAGSPTFSMSVVGTRRNSKHSACLITKFAAYGYLQEMVAKV